MGCWLGKAVGGTLGMPYEGVRETLDLHFYDPVPTEMLPNDDLDLQVIYAFLLDRMGPQPCIDRHVLTEAWRYIGMSPDEYGICKRNLKLGLLPPLTGSYDNPFTAGMGAAIRTELWACLAPGDPDRAVAYAVEDACMDHADEGVYAAKFLAALESLAFVESNTDRLLDRSLRYIPADCRTARAIDDTRRWWGELRDWRQVQQRLAEKYLNDNFTDVAINLAYIVLGWKAGQDFGEAICIAVNCGQDTDCTGATLGALLGILDPDGIADRWLAPIGRDLVLSPCCSGVEHPSTLDGFTDLVLDLRERLQGVIPAVPDPNSAAVRRQLDGLAIIARVGQLGEMPSGEGLPAGPADVKSTYLTGHHQTASDHPDAGPVLWLQYPIDLAETQHGCLMFATPQAVKVWWDDQLVIDSQGGNHLPAFHRTEPRDQLVSLELDRGSHQITACIDVASSDRPLEWVVGLCDDVPGRRVERNWIIAAFRRRG